MAGKVARGDVRLYQFAPPDKKRPVVVLTRDSAIAYLSTVTVAPITSTIRGVPSEVVLNESADAGSLRGFGLFSRVRSQSILAQARHSEARTHVSSFGRNNPADHSSVEEQSRNNVTTRSLS